MQELLTEGRRVGVVGLCLVAWLVMRRVRFTTMERVFGLAGLAPCR
ncbi:hypothetical protein [Nonomuraea aurantiaca]|nr:hypothetical protein [Nonomuraea aurantiaca]MCA2230135.1 hypothetical protein [Nonomuraea aurantiaca]